MPGARIDEPMHFDGFMMMAFIERLFEPFVASLLMLVAGLVTAGFFARRRLGLCLIGAATALLLMIAYGTPFELLARRLEGRYHPLADLDTVRQVGWIVVLGGGHRGTSDLPPNSRLGNASLYRVVEAVRLHRALPATRILFSGGRTLDSTADSQVTSAAALGMGVAPQDVSLSVDPRSTAEEMTCLRGIIGAAPFIMVTSAMHMPRAMLLAERAGLHPVPSPTDYRGSTPGFDGWLDLLPRSGAPLLASAVTHELAGLAVLELTGRFSGSAGNGVACATSSAHSPNAAPE
jgi:uncharacterized SAM-binding protein YcdF (DUF218 family)